MAARISGDRQGTSLRLATHPWPETTGEYCRNSPGLCSPHSPSEEGGQARRFTVLIEASESGRGLGRRQYSVMM